MNCVSIFELQPASVRLGTYGPDKCQMRVIWVCRNEGRQNLGGKGEKDGEKSAKNDEREEKKKEERKRRRR